jgi:hypothetical protein
VNSGLAFIFSPERNIVFNFHDGGNVSLDACSIEQSRRNGAQVCNYSPRLSLLISGREFILGDEPDHTIDQHLFVER